MPDSPAPASPAPTPWEAEVDALIAQHGWQRCHDAACPGASTPHAHPAVLPPASDAPAPPRENHPLCPKCGSIFVEPIEGGDSTGNTQRCLACHAAFTPRLPSLSTTMTDSEIATRLREAVGQVNHFCHVAEHRGLFVQITAANEKGRAISDVCVMRPVLPPEVPDAG